MKLSQELAKIFESELEKTMQREMNEPDFLPQEDFPDCKERAAMIMIFAMGKVERMLALAIATHREMKHEENRDGEIEYLSTRLTPEEIEVSIRGWWSD